MCYYIEQLKKIILFKNISSIVTAESNAGYGHLIKKYHLSFCIVGHVFLLQIDYYLNYLNQLVKSMSILDRLLSSVLLSKFVYLKNNK